MATSAASQRLERIEKFLDNIDKVGNPNDLQEPFRSLWLRIHGEKPTMMSEERQKAMLSGGFSRELFGDVEISPAMKEEGSKGSIEFISPKDVGPTVEMEVEEKKVTFKKADTKDLKLMETKEKAADIMIELQNMVKPLSGLGGEVAKIWEGITDIARDYRDGQYEKAQDLGTILKKKVETDDFKKSVVVELQKKIGEYQDLGGDLTKAKDKFRELAATLKEGDKDLIKLAGEVNALAEDSISDVVEEEVVVQIKSAPKKEPKAPERKEIEKVKPIPELPEGEEEEEETEEEFPEEMDQVIGSEEEPEEGEKPVIKILTVKKLVPVKKVRKERKEYRDQIEKAAMEEKAAAEPELDEDEIEDDDDFEMDDTGLSEEEEFELDEEEEELEEEDIEEEEPEPVQESGEEGTEKSPEEEGKESKTAADGTPLEDIQNAFKKYQFVYNASIKMNEAGKDVSQIFDLMNYAEKSRQNGNMKAYVGVCNQMENMLIKLQTGK